MGYLYRSLAQPAKKRLPMAPVVASADSGRRGRLGEAGRTPRESRELRYSLEAVGRRELIGIEQSAMEWLGQRGAPVRGSSGGRDGRRSGRGGAPHQRVATNGDGGAEQ
jgi:hypothetical protein